MAKNKEPVQADMFPAEVDKAALNSKAVALHSQAAAMAQTLADAGIEAGDLEIPLLMLMQNTSAQVGEGKAKLGDILNTETKEVVGGFTQPLEIVPLRMFKTIRVYDLNHKPRKFMRSEPLDSRNENLPTEGLENGVPIKRELNLNFYVLLKKDIDNGEAFPFLVRFKSTSMTAGKQIATAMFKQIALGRLPYAQTTFLTVSKEKKDQNYYAAFGTNKGQSADINVLSKAEEWVKNMSSMSVRVKDVEDTESEAVQTATPTVVGKSAAGELY